MGQQEWVMAGVWGDAHDAPGGSIMNQQLAAILIVVIPALASVAVTVIRIIQGEKSA